MSSFWSTSDGDDLSKAPAEKEYDGGGGSFDLIPDKTNCLMSIASAAWAKDRSDNEYVNLQWSVIKPDSLANRRVFQKIWCKDDDPSAKDPAKKRDKALKMLAAIDANAGGKLAKAGREPDDDDLALALTNKQMMAKVMVWSMDDREKPGEKIEGNWISAVGPKGGSMAVSEVAEKPKRGESRRPADDDLDGDQIPF